MDEIDEFRELLLKEIGGTLPTEQDGQIINEIKSLKFKMLGDMLRHFKKYPQLEKFCNDYIKNYDGLILVSYEKNEEEYEFPDELIQSLRLKLSGKESGVFKIDMPQYNYYQLKALMRILQKKGTIQPIFLISPNMKISGKITTQLYPQKQRITLCSRLSFYRKNKHTKETEKIFSWNYIDEYIDNRGRRMGVIDVEEATANYYIYTFVTDKNEQLLLLSEDKINSSIVEVEGLMVTTKKEYEFDRAKIGGKQPLFIAYSIKSAIKPLNFEEVKNFIKNYSINDILNHLLGKYRHPPFFENLILSWLFSGKWAGYPLHLFWVARNGSGKTTLLKQLRKAFDETTEVWDGTTSTIKGLVPSFAQKPLPGDFLAYNRIAPIDEFLRMIIKLDIATRGQELGKLNSLLEHQVGLKSGSAHGSISILPTSKAIFGTNPLYGSKDISSLCTSYDEGSFWARVLIFFQPQSHLEYIDKRKMYVQAQKDVKDIPIIDWLNFYDWLQNQFIIIGDEVITKIKRLLEKYRTLVPSVMLDSFDGRYDHHFICLLDGIHKLHCLIEKTPEAIIGKPTENDYEMLDEMISDVIGSWSVDMTYITKIHPKARLTYLTAKARDMYEKIDNDFKGKISEEQLRDLFKEPQYINELISMEVIKKNGTDYLTFWRTM